MSAKLMGEVWELDIPHQAAWVLMSLADHAEHDGSQVYPGNGLTAWKTGYSEATVKRVLKILSEELGLIARVSEGGGGQRAEWRIVVERFDEYRKPPPAKRGRPRKLEAVPEPENPGQDDPPIASDNPGQNNPGQNKRGLSGKKPGSPSRAHDDRNHQLEPSGSLSALKGRKRTTKGAIKGLTRDEAEFLIQEAMKDDPHRELLRDLVRLAAAENKSEEIKLTRIWNDFVEPYVKLRAENDWTDADWRYGFQETIRKGIGSIGYVRSVTANHANRKRGARPVREIEHVFDEGPRSREPDLTPDEIERLKAEHERKYNQGERAAGE